jgi:hypothetical protein
MAIDLFRAASAGAPDGTEGISHRSAAERTSGHGHFTTMSELPSIAASLMR